MKTAQLYKYNKRIELQLAKHHKTPKLKIVEIDTPVIKDGEVLVKVRSAAVNPLEVLIGAGGIRLIKDYKLPTTLGNEISGEIVKIGNNVLDFKIGDYIYSRLPMDNLGGFAEYVAVDHRMISVLPKNLNFKSGASAPLGALTAYQAIYEELSAKAGQSIFIPGISGSFGQMALPIAKELGMIVYGSGNARDKNRLINLGVDKYFDYTKENYWELLNDVDYVIDTLGPKEYTHELSVLKHGGKIVSLIDGPNKRFAIEHKLPLWKKWLFSFAGSKFDKEAERKDVDYHFVFVRPDGNQLNKITKIIEENKIVPIYDEKNFSIDEINDALEYMNSGKAHGKVLINFD